VKPRPRRLLTAAAGLLTGVVAAVAGVAPARALVLAATVALVLAVVGETADRPGRWPPPLPGPTRSAWTEVEHLADVLDSRERDPRQFDAVVRRRLRGLAANALARSDVAWESPRAAELLGRPLWTALDTDAEPLPAGVTRSTLVRTTLDAVERIGSASDVPGSAPAPAPTPGGHL